MRLRKRFISFGCESEMNETIASTEGDLESLIYLNNINVIKYILLLLLFSLTHSLKIEFFTTLRSTFTSFRQKNISHRFDLRLRLLIIENLLVFNRLENMCGKILQYLLWFIWFTFTSFVFFL